VTACSILHGAAVGEGVPEDDVSLVHDADVQGALHQLALAGVAAGGGYKVPAAQLIEACGLRGRRFGRAGVAERHALVLVNHGGASGSELLAAAVAVEDVVMERFEVRLEREVRVIGGEGGRA